MKKTLIKIAISIAVILIVILVYIFAPKSASEGGKITLKIYDNNDILFVNSEYEFDSGEYLYKLLNDNFEITMSNDNMLLSIKNTDGILNCSNIYESYIKIIVNGKYSNHGVTTLALKDGMVIELSRERII